MQIRIRSNGGALHSKANTPSAKGALRNRKHRRPLLGGFAAQLIEKRRGSVLICPMPQVAPVERVEAHGDDVAGVGNVFFPPPAEFLNDNVLCSGEPDTAAQSPYHASPPPAEALLVMRVRTQVEKLDREP